MGKEEDPTPPGLKPVKRQQNKITAKWACKVANRWKAKQLKHGHSGDRDAQRNLSKTLTSPGRMQKPRHKQTSRKEGEVKEAERVARSKTRNEQTLEEVEESREQDTARKQVERVREQVRARNRNKEVSMETVDEEDKEDLLLSIDAALRDTMTHLHQTKDRYDANICRARICIVCDCFIQSCGPE